MSEKSLRVRIGTRLHRNKIWSAFLNATGSSLQGQSWIFIIGCYNSGTTLLEEILAHHSDISDMGDEGVMLTDVLPRPEDFGWRRMWHRCEGEMKMDLHAEEKGAARIKKHWSHFYSKKKFLLEKSISNTPRALFFERNFQPAYFIHIVRNGYAVAEGIKRKASVMVGNPYAEAGSYPIEVCAEQWKRSMEVVDEAKGKLKNFIEVKYEDLTERPQETMRQITEFLKMSEINPTLLSGEFSVHRRTEPIMNMNDRSIVKLSQVEIEKINKVAGEYLKKYGYYQDESK